MAIEYRGGEVGDLPHLIDLGKAFAREQNSYWRFNKLGEGSGQFIRDAMQMAVTHPAARIFVAADGETLAGYVLGQIMEPPPIFEKNPYVFVSDLYVRPEYRRRGIGTHLVENCRGWALTQGIWRLSLVIAESNAAIKLYEKLGFEPMERLLFWADPELGK